MVDRLITGVGVVVAASLLLVSIWLPYWTIKLEAPQYPEGLWATTYVTHLTGDVREIDELNHYIGMMRLDDAAALEKRVAVYAMVSIAALALLSWALRGWLRWALRLPLVLFPAGFVADLAYWLWYAGNHLDPTAALSSSIKPFTPAVLGRGTIGQFHTVARFELGFWLALLGAAVAILTLLWPEEEAQP
ncbi:MAG: cytochrome C [Bacillota bacterium]